MTLYDPFAAYQAALTRTGGRPSLEGLAAPYAPQAAVLWAQSVPGWMTPDELLWLAQQAGKLKDGGTWVEVGAWKGRSFAAVALAVSLGCVVFAVDHWLGSEGERGLTHKNARESFEYFLSVKSALEELRPDASLMVLNEPSVASAAGFFDASLDVVFIDASHGTDSVKQDVRAWLPKVKPGGLLCGHDGFNYDVQQGLRETLGHWERGPQSIWYHRAG